MEGGLIMVVLSAEIFSLQKSFFQSHCLRRCQLSVAMEVRKQSEEYCRTRAYFSLFAQRRLSRFLRTMMRDLVQSGAMYSYLLMFMTHIEGISLGTPLGRRRRRQYSWREVSTYVSFSRRQSFSSY